MFVMKSVSAMFLLTFVIIFDNETIYLYIIEIIIITLFQVTYDEPSKSFYFNENIQEKKLEESKFSIWDDMVSIHSVKWNPNPKFRVLIATSGVGWIRVESAYM